MESDLQLDAEYLKSKVRAEWLDIVVFNEIDSTSDWLKERSNQNKLVCLAEQQTAGRGRHGNQWSSPESGNIYLSYSWQFDTPPEHLGLLSLWVGLVVAETLGRLGVSEHGVKWPNDLYWCKQKLGGILIEASNVSSRLVIGIGLNVNMQSDSSIDQSWVSLSQIFGKALNRNEVLVPLLDELHDAMVSFPLLEGREFMAQWGKWDLIVGKKVTFCEKNETFEGVAQGVDSKGYLRVKMPQGELRSLGTNVSKVRW